MMTRRDDTQRPAFAKANAFFIQAAKKEKDDAEEEEEEEDIDGEKNADKFCPRV